MASFILKSENNLVTYIAMYQSQIQAKNIFDKLRQICIFQKENIIKTASVTYELIHGKENLIGKNYNREMKELSWWLLGQEGIK